MGNNGLQAFRQITVVVDIAGEQRTARIAAEFARRSGAHLVGLTFAYDPVLPVYTVAAPLPADFIVEAREQAMADAKASASAFESIGSAAGISFETQTVETNAAGGLADLVARCSLTDLVVVGQQTPERSEPMREALIEAVLFQSGVPAMIVPAKNGGELKTDHAMVAWDGSSTAARAVRAALPLLGLAKSITIVIVDDGKKRSGEPGADVAAFLARHSLAVTVKVIPNSQKGVADALLSHAAAGGADWIAMGAYGHGRFREFILGGATRGILEHMTVPVLMAH
jgi:nucleotide-binding universal stress UspA family protein